MDSDFEDFFDEYDEEIVMYLERSYVVRSRPNHMEQWSDSEFFNRFRMAKLATQNLLQQIEHLLQHRTNRY